MDHPHPELIEALHRILPPERILSRPIDRLGRSIVHLVHEALLGA
jgi:hypothetical protein